MKLRLRGRVTLLGLVLCMLAGGACTVMNGLSVPVLDAGEATSSGQSSGSTSGATSSGSSNGGTSSSGNSDPNKDEATTGLPTCAARGGTCLAQGTACKQSTDTLRCDVVGQFCCVVVCPVLPPPSCPGSRPVPTWDPATRCKGFACAPIGCPDAGGTCGANAQCPAGTMTGAAADYPCTDSTTCCLPTDT